MTPDAFSAVQHPVVGSGLHAYVPHSFEVTDIAATGSACFIASRPVGAGMQGYRDTLVFGAGLSASWAEVARPRDIEEQYDCSGALKIHLRLAGESAITDGRDVASHEVLANVAGAAGLDADAARDVLASGAHADAVRAQERLYLSRGIQAVPSVVFNDAQMIQGGQPVELFEQALRQLARPRAQA